MTPGYGSWKSNRQLPSLRKWHSKESADTLAVRRHEYTSTCLTQTADTWPDATSTRNATCATQWHWGSSPFRNRRCTTQICIYTYSTSQRSIFQLWCICQGLQAQYRLYSRFADCCRNIHWLVHYLLCGNAADIHFADDSSLLSKQASEDEHWLEGPGFMSVLFSTISRHIKVYFRGYIHMYY